MIWFSLKLLIGIYLVGFVFFFWIELTVGPVTPALAFLRAAVWPVFWATGWPHGVPTLPID